MIALDTNVLVRFLVEDDARQTAQAKQLIANIIISNHSATAYAEVADVAMVVAFS